jgi:hypothetical protein
MPADERTEMDTDNWTTRVLPEFTRQYGVDELHSVLFLPKDWPGKGAAVTLGIPECELLCVFVGEDGEPVTFINRPQVILREDGMPSRSYFYAFMDAEPSRKDAYTRARLSWCDYWAEKVMMISLDRSGDIMVEDGKAVADHARIQRDRLITDNAKWLLGKWGRRTYGDRVEAEAGSLEGPITISWLGDKSPAIAPEPSPPKQITYQKPELPADLTDADWSVMLQVLEAIKRTIPTNSDSPPAEVFEVIRKAVLEHFREEPAPKPVVLKPRGKSGK